MPKIVFCIAKKKETKTKDEIVDQCKNRCRQYECRKLGRECLEQSNMKKIVLLLFLTKTALVSPWLEFFLISIENVLI